jgi:hypothetical protein
LELFEKTPHAIPASGISIAQAFSFSHDNIPVLPLRQGKKDCAVYWTMVVLPIVAMLFIAQILAASHHIVAVIEKSTGSTPHSRSLIVHVDSLLSVDEIGRPGYSNRLLLAYNPAAYQFVVFGPCEMTARDFSSNDPSILRFS